MQNWTWKTWASALLSILPIVLGVTYFSIIPPMEQLRNEGPGALLPIVLNLLFASIVLAFLGFGGHLIKQFFTGKATVFNAIGFGLAILAGPSLTAFEGLVLGGGTHGFVCGWFISSCAFPIYWFQHIKPDYIPEI